MSLPSRERGLKYQFYLTIHLHENVAPFAGAWIEIADSVYKSFSKLVAPFAGAWIEMLP